ncbi:hypothetical protein GQ54DRAFT_298530 [Martensiomyces pterosporus]|nr:hypothetical protein GQ54DRAFT_298530 [Martensiomyces pterosporus]
MDAIIDSEHKYKKAKSSGYWDDTPSPNDGYGTQAGTSWAGFLLLLQLLLFAASVANARRLFSSRRTYQLRMKDADSSLLTSSCKRVSLRTRRPQWAHSLWGRALWAVWKLIARVDDKIQGEIWELSMWTPSTFSRNLFCWCSPVQLLILSFMNGSNWYYILPLAAAVAGQCTFLVVTYATLVKDKQLLFGEVYNEYNQSFVNPRVFASKRDVGTSTLEDWAAARRENPYGYMARSQEVAERLRRRTTAMASQEIDPRPYLPGDVAGPGVARGHGRERALPPPIASAGTVIRDRRSKRMTMNTASAQANDGSGGMEEHSSRHVAPSGTQKVRDRSAKRRRHTEIIENMKHGK